MPPELTNSNVDRPLPSGECSSSKTSSKPPPVDSFYAASLTAFAPGDSPSARSDRDAKWFALIFAAVAAARGSCQVSTDAPKVGPAPRGVGGPRLSADFRGGVHCVMVRVSSTCLPFRKRSAWSPVSGSLSRGWSPPSRDVGLEASRGWARERGRSFPFAACAVCWGKGGTGGTSNASKIASRQIKTLDLAAYLF